MIAVEQSSIAMKSNLPKISQPRTWRLTRAGREFCIPTTGTKVPSGPLQTSPTKQNIRRANSGGKQ
jgi:hypothetical protein